MEKFGEYIRIGFRYRRHLGPRLEAAGVSVSLAPKDSYEFENAARWPEVNCGGAVERGLLDGLRDLGYDPDLGIRVLLDAVEYDPVNSSEHAFYVAAKCAAKSLGEIRR